MGAINIFFLIPFFSLLVGCGSSGGSSGSSDTTVKQVAGGFLHLCAVVGSSAKCWGSLNGAGQLGNNSTTKSTTPVQVEGLTDGVTFVAAGSNSSCAIVNSAAKCWGGNAYGQLGNNSTTDSLVPVQVFGLTSGVTHIAIGTYHACAVVDGGVKCWGSNTGGALGDGTDTDSLVPVTVAQITSGATQVAVNMDVSCAVVNGAAKCWGFNFNGCLGDGNKPNSSNIPVQVTGLTSGVTAIASHSMDWFTCAEVNGAVYCWGKNDKGQLGDGTTTDRSTPVLVEGLTGLFSGVVTGTGFACVGESSGKVWCWGKNSSGQLGDGTTTDALAPVEVKGLSGKPTSGGANYAAGCAVITGGTLECWGSGIGATPTKVNF